MNEVLCRETEHGFFRVFLLALGVGKENQVHNFLVQSPCRGEVDFEIASCYLMTARMVHAKCYFANGCSTIVLRHCSPCVPECIDTIAVIACYPYVLANLFDATVGVRAKTVRVTVAYMEAE